jgi:hypothetical protein
MACSSTLALLPWNSRNSVGCSRQLVFEWALIAFIVVPHRASLRAIGTPDWSVWITVFTAPAMSEKEQTAAEIASGTGWSLTVNSVMMPSVPSEPTKSASARSRPRTCATGATS